MVEGKTGVSSLVALLAATGFAVAASLPAQAADLGGNCCADLEERVAELEATTVRKGNRKVSLQLYGQVSQAVLFWDDGGESNVYQLENNNIKNRLGVRGSAKINSDWSAGYQIELQIRSGRSSSADQFPLATTQGSSITVFNTRSVSLRVANWNLKSNSYGTLTVGRQADPTSGTGSVNLVNPDGFASPAGFGYAMQDFRLRRAGSTGNTGLSALRWDRGASTDNGSSVVSYSHGSSWHGVRYTSPFFLGQSKSTGFQLSTGWGMDDTWQAALRYAGEFGGFRVAAGLGYYQYTGNPDDRGACSNLGVGGGGNTVSATSCDSLQASASVLHTPTGLYVSGGWSEWNDDNRQQMVAAVRRTTVSGVDDTDSFWWVQAGWNAKLNSLGKTTFWGQYMEINAGFHLDGTNGTPRTVTNGDAINPGIGTAWITSSDWTMWGFGVTQAIDAAAMNLYLGYLNASADLKLLNTGATSTANAVNSNAISDHQTVYAGATIKF